eukprot:TRINITY_DN1559_c0_g1_i2.p2 TRINITY_DN1559_c0_g1~~TRINITY_DN1559_c0_g1_i2.p2  ORF type:complete len:172 (+),score=10.91 TRINITY_DN1559_c0_g1_i2:440-955(+)
MRSFRPPPRTGTLPPTNNTVPPGRPGPLAVSALADFPRSADPPQAVPLADPPQAVPSVRAPERAPAAGAQRAIRYLRLGSEGSEEGSAYAGATLMCGGPPSEGGWSDSGSGSVGFCLESPECRRVSELEAHASEDDGVADSASEPGVVPDPKRQRMCPGDAAQADDSDSDW